MSRVRTVGVIAWIITAAALLLPVSPAWAGPTDLGATVGIAAGSDPDVAVDNEGNLHVVYVRGFTTYYKKITGDYTSGSISPEYTVGYGANPQVAVDSNNDPHVVFGKADYSRWNGNGFTSQVRAFDAWRKNLIAVDSQDRVYVIGDIYSPRTTVVKVYKNGAELTAYPVKIGDDNPGGCDIDANDVLHYVWRKSGVHYYTAYTYGGGSPGSIPIQGATSDFSWCSVDPSDQSVHYFGTVAYANGIYHKAKRNGQWGATTQYAQYEAHAEDGDFVNPVSAADMEGYKYCTFRGRNGEGWFFVLDANDRLVSGVFQIDPENHSAAGGKLTNPNVASRPDMNGAFVVWGTDTVLLRSIGDVAFGSAPIPAFIPAADYDGDGADDPATYDTASGTWSVMRRCIGLEGLPIQKPFMEAGDTPIVGDFDGNPNNGVEIGVCNPAQGYWAIYNGDEFAPYNPALLWEVSPAYGTSGDVPVIGDFDGDGTDDLGIYRRDENGGTNTWYIRGALTNTYTGLTTINFGVSNAVPMCGNWNDGNAGDEFVVWNPSTKTFQIYGVSFWTGQFQNQIGDVFGQDFAVPADYDGDDLLDFAVFRPETARWFYNGSSGTNSGVGGIQLGAGTDIPTPGKYDPDNKADLTVVRDQSLWFIRSSLRNDLSLWGMAPFPWGTTGDVPVPGDWDQDGTTDLAVFRPSTATWYVRGSSGFYNFVFGAPGDVPVPADWDGDDEIDVAVFRPSTARWYRYGTSDGPMPALTFGAPTDIPVPAKYDGDARADIAVYRDGVWLIFGTQAGGIRRAFGTTGWLPIPADYTTGDGGQVELGIYRSTDAFWSVSSSSWGPRGTPCPSDFDNDGDIDRATFSSGWWWIDDDGTLLHSTRDPLPLRGAPMGGRQP